MTGPLLRPWFAAAASLLLCSAAAWPAVADEWVWELSPYRIRLLIAAEAAPPITPALVSQLQVGLAERVSANIGGPWDFSVGTPSQELAAQMLADLGALSVGDLPEEFATQDEYDKLLLLALHGDEQALRLEVREADVRTQLLGVVVRRDVPQRGFLVDVAFAALRTAFAPLALVEAVDGRQVKLRLRAGGLAPRDAELALVAGGQLFRPVVRYNDRDGTPRHIEPIEWTWLRADGAEGSLLQCELITGVRSPLSSRRRGRVEQLALAVGPAGGATTLRLRARDDPQRPLAGYRVYAQWPGSPETELLGATDASGQIHITAEPDAALRLLLVTNGAEPLARLPLLAGYEQELTATLRGDDTRLLVEGMISGLQEQLVDYVIRRRVLVVRAYAALSENQPEEAKQLLDELRAQGTPDQFVETVRRQRLRLQSADPQEQARIDRLFDDTLAAVHRFVRPEEVQELEMAIAKARAP